MYAVSVAIFTTVGFQQVYGQTLVRASTVGFFGAVFHVYARTDATARSSFVVRAIQYLRSITLVRATSKAVFSVGRIARVYGRTSVFVVGRWTARVKVAFKATTSAVVTTLERFGIQRIVFGTTEPTVITSQVGFTTFGEYAPEVRFIIVQTEDRKAMVV